MSHLTSAWLLQVRALLSTNSRLVSSGLQISLLQGKPGCCRHQQPGPSVVVDTRTCAAGYNQQPARAGGQGGGAGLCMGW